MPFNWHAALAKLQIWPLSCSKAEIAEMTPRQIFDLWTELRQMAPKEGEEKEKPALPTREKFARIRYVDGKLVLEQPECPKPSPSPTSATTPK